MGKSQDAMPAPHGRQTSTSSLNSKEEIMSNVSYIPKDYNSVTPYLIIKGAAQAI